MGKKIGKQGENFCSKYLLSKNYSILHRNYHSKYGEIDIIAKAKETIIFIEVKTRTSSLENAISSVSKRKIKKISKTAVDFLSKNPQYCDNFTRFDVIALKKINAENRFIVKHLEDAFTPELT